MAKAVKKHQPEYGQLEQKDFARMTSENCTVMEGVREDLWLSVAADDDASVDDDCDEEKEEGDDNQSLLISDWHMILFLNHYFLIR